MSLGDGDVRERNGDLRERNGATSERDGDVRGLRGEVRGPVFVFPGQGSQQPGMGRELTAFDAEARKLVAAATQATGLPLAELMTAADAPTLADPHVAQLVVFVWSSVALHDLRAAGMRPAAVAGHSLGEYTALVACGSLDWDSALDLVSFRGRAMAKAARARAGTMGAVVGLPLSDVERLCAEASGGTGRPVGEGTGNGEAACCGDTAGDGAAHGGERPHPVAVVANVNSARQVIVSGSVDAVGVVLEAATAAGALRARPIPVGGAYHSPLMADAQREMAPLLRAADLRPPRVALVSGVSGRPVTDIDEYRHQLLEQITRPVRWHAVLDALAGFDEFVEVGPGRVLCGLGRESLRAARHLTARQASHAARHPIPHQAARAASSDSGAALATGTPSLAGGPV